jgi:xanthine dehydrogenase YagS FAD-binding subunit
MPTRFAYIRPDSLREALAQLSSEDAVVHAGGTDLMGCLRDHVLEAKKLVSISGLSQLKGIREAGDGGLRIGALTTITQIAESPVILERYPGLARGALEVASPQLRNQGTIGGNLCQKPRCWYYRGEFHCLRKGGDLCYAIDGENLFHCILGGDHCYIVHPSDTAPPLVALSAVAHIAGPGGTRTVPVEKFHVSPSEDPQRETVLKHNEILTEIYLPPSKGQKSTYRKVRARRSWDFALAGVALCVAMEGNTVTQARVVLSGAAPVPWRAESVERAIAGKRLDKDTLRHAAAAAVEGASPLAQNQYKIPLIQGVIQEELSRIAGNET